MNSACRVSAFACAACLAAVAHAGGVGPPLTIWSDAIENLGNVVAFSPTHGAFLVVWWSQQGSYTYDIWARPVTVEGALLPGFNVDTSEAVRLLAPAVAYGSVQDQYLVAYTRIVDGTGHGDIWAHRTDWNSRGSTQRIYIDTASLEQRFPAVAYSEQADEFLVVYENEADTTPTYELSAVRVTAATGAVTPPLTVAASAPGDYRTAVDVAFDPINNRYVIGYDFVDAAGATTAVFVKTMSPDLTSISAEHEIASGTLASGTWDVLPAVAVSPHGALVAWQKQHPDSASVYGVRTTLDGTPIGAPGGFEIAHAGPNTHLQTIDVAYDGPGGYLMVWASFNTLTGESNVQGRFVSASHDGPSSPPFDIQASADFEADPTLASTGNGLSLVTLLQNTGTDGDILGRMVSSVVFFDGFESGNTTAWSSVVP